MRVSIIIPVKAINAYIDEALVHIKALAHRDYEVLVLPDNGAMGHLDGARVIPTGPMGPAGKRDLAARAATGEVLAFLDDDAYPTAEWLCKALRHFSDNGVAAVGGPAVTPREDSARQKGSGEVFSSWLASGGYAYRYVPGELRDVDDLPTVNLLVRKDVFLRLGGFDTRYWPGEDTKLCHDIRAIGLRIVYDPEAAVFHHRRPLFRGHLQQVARYGAQRGYFVRALPGNSLKPGYFAPSLFLIFIASGPFAAAYGGFIMWAGVAMLYAALLAVASARAALNNGSIAVGALTAPGIFLTHIVYGYNFLKGLLSLKKGVSAGEGLSA